jgi:hypothetical protein
VSLRDVIDARCSELRIRFHRFPAAERGAEEHRDAWPVRNRLCGSAARPAELGVGRPQSEPSGSADEGRNQRDHRDRGGGRQRQGRLEPSRSGRTGLFVTTAPAHERLAFVFFVFFVLQLGLIAACAGPALLVVVARRRAQYM